MRTLFRRVLKRLAPDDWGGAVVRAVAVLLFLPLVLSPAGGSQPATFEPAEDTDPVPDSDASTAAPIDAPGSPSFRPPEVPGGGVRPEARVEAGTGPGTDVANSAPAVPDVPERVKRKQPDLLVRPQEPVTREHLAAARKIEGVRQLAPAVKMTVRVPAPPRVRKQGQKRVKLDLLVVDPRTFRPLTPESTAQTKAVWERVLAGEMMVRHDIAQNLELPLGGRTVLSGPAGSREVRIGAFASNGTPPVAEAVVARSVGADLGAARPNLFIAAVGEEPDISDVGQALVAAVGGGDFGRVKPPQQQEAVLRGAGAHNFQPFTYIDHGDGMITIDSNWVAQNIASADVPIFGTVRCHRVMLPQLHAALAEVEQRGLAHLIDTSQYGGCWVPRHILFNPARSLSMHAWGLAIDFNVSTNGYGATPQMDRRIVEIFQRWGFRWGGTWSTPDGMHFELASIIQQ